MIQIHRHTIAVAHFSTLVWHGECVVDWHHGGKCYSTTGHKTEIGQYRFAFSFDAAINSDCGTYVLLYKRLGTKALLLKNGKELREINRPYYQAEAYEYPCAFYTQPSTGRVLLIHCPKEYCRLDIEDVETGELLTDTPARKPQDIFHSRLCLSPQRRFLLSRGWVWQPWDVAEVYDLEACLQDPTLLDAVGTLPNIQTEICSADFIDDERLLLVASAEDGIGFTTADDPLPPNHLTVYNLRTRTYTPPVRLRCLFGRVVAIDERYAWDLFLHPKIIDLQTGEAVAIIESLLSGEQHSAICDYVALLPDTAYHRGLRSLAFISGSDVEILTVLDSE